jgi:hypothetical protein
MSFKSFSSKQSNSSNDDDK